MQFSLAKLIAITATVAVVVGVAVGLSVWAVYRTTDDSDETTQAPATTTSTTASPTTVPSTAAPTTSPTVGSISFPNNFKIGAASASYQIEGAWNEDGKSPNIWDTITHEDPKYVRDLSNGDVAADSYHFYQKDIDALTNIGVSKYF